MALAGEPESDQIARIQLTDGDPNDRHEEEHDNTSRRQNHPGGRGGVAEQSLQQLRNQYGTSVECQAKHEHHEAGYREGAVLQEQSDIDNRSGWKYSQMIAPRMPTTVSTVKVTMKREPNQSSR